MTLSIIIPVLNERPTIARVVERVAAVDVGMPKQVIVVDAASTDGTREYLQSLPSSAVSLVLLDRPTGKGHGLRRGLEHADGDYVVFQDGDMELDPLEIPLLFPPLLRGEADVVFGARFLQGRGATPLGGYLGNRALTQFANLLFHRRLNDILTAYKLFPREVLASVEMRAEGFDVDADITTQLLRRGFRIAEVPVSYCPRSRSEGKKLAWTSGFVVAWAILRGRFRRLQPLPAPQRLEEGLPTDR